jgi:hypothetical protein
MSHLSSKHLGLALNAAKSGTITPEFENLFEASLTRIGKLPAETYGVYNLALAFNAYGAFATKSPRFRALLSHQAHEIDELLLGLALAQPPEEYTTWHSISCMVSGAVKLGWSQERMHSLLGFMSSVSQHCVRDKGSPQSAALIVHACATVSYVDTALLQRISVSMLSRVLRAITRITL